MVPRLTGSLDTDGDTGFVNGVLQYAGTRHDRFVAQSLERRFVEQHLELPAMD